MEAGIGGQSLYYVGCILFSKIKNQKKAFNLKTKYRYKIQIQNTDTNTKYKVININKNNNEKQHTTNNKQQT